jgi:hypothetical protein
MAYNKEIIEKARDLAQQGYTQKQITNATNVDERTLRRWKKRGYFIRSSPVPTTIQRPTVPENTVKNVGEYVWPTITAADLVKVGFRADKTPIIVAALGMAKQQMNNRLSRFLKTYIDIVERWPDILHKHEGWRAIISGFPILAEDIGAPSLGKLSDLVSELHPYLSKESRREYHRRVRPILVGILAEVQAFLQDAAMAGGFPIAVTTGPPSFPWPEGKSYKVDDSLEKGHWTYAFTSFFFYIMDYKKMDDIPVGHTWAGRLFDMVSRLPDPDRQHGQFLKKIPLTGVLYLWCATAPSDFIPPFPDIRRTLPENLGGTLAGIYQTWADQDSI